MSRVLPSGVEAVSEFHVGLYGEHCNCEDPPRPLSGYEAAAYPVIQ